MGSQALGSHRPWGQVLHIAQAQLLGEAPRGGAAAQGCHNETARAAWKKPTDIKAQYRNASFLKNRRVVFNAKGNDYRLVVAVPYRIGVVYVKFVGTHAQYDVIDAETVEIE